MQKVTFSKLSISTLLVLLLAACVTSAGEWSKHVDKEGKITLAKDFRTNMIHLGSWYVPDGDASGFHDVYTEKESADYYRKNGKFPDGATIIKELRAASKGDYTTGRGVAYANDSIKQTFVMVKDAKGRFKSSPLWGNGWGWALFKPESGPAKNLAKEYKNDCLGCHVPAQNNDWIYVEAYPTLTK